MTAIAIWFNDENPDNPCLWVAGDSRVSQKEKTDTGNDKYSRLIDDAVKILTLPVVCKYPDENRCYSKISHYHTYGYCFAGSTLFGQNSFLALMPLLSNLVADQPYTPSMEDIAEFISKYLNRVFEEYMNPGSEFEVALFGWCPIQNKYYIFHYHHHEKDKKGIYFIFKKEIFTDLKKKDFVYLGCDKNNICLKIQAAFNGDDIPGRPLSRIPQHIIQDYIQDPNEPKIGGDLQLGIANQYGFKPFSICKPRVIGKPEAYLSYLGYDLHQDNVGDARVGLTGMS
ncbi:hypothetical protein [Anabaena sp. PCC 7108]|uniref:hypothetical protein n=1 Tax=Anabaena sp. PCC 7108 TaxID=163908 RepID=UPI00034C2655|nr:hypothetical protein [Anabaena sp. PCC 7108]